MHRLGPDTQLLQKLTSDSGMEAKRYQLGTAKTMLVFFFSWGTCIHFCVLGVGDDLGNHCSLERSQKKFIRVAVKDCMLLGKDRFIFYIA